MTIDAEDKACKINLKYNKITINNRKTNRFAMIKGEIKNIEFVITDKNDDTIDCSSATLLFHAKETKGAAADLTVLDGAMDKTDAATGTVYVPVDTTTLTHSTDYYCELKLTFSASSIDHSGEIIMTINQPIVE